MNVNFTAAELWRVHTTRELRVLHLIHMKLCDEVRTLAANMGVQKPCVTRAFDALENRGLGKRKPHETDKRCMHFVLTDEGVRAAREIFDGK